MREKILTWPKYWRSSCNIRTKGVIFFLFETDHRNASLYFPANYRHTFSFLPTFWSLDNERRRRNKIMVPWFEKKKKKITYSGCYFMPHRTRHCVYFFTLSQCQYWEYKRARISGYGTQTTRINCRFLIIKCNSSIEKRWMLC